MTSEYANDVMIDSSSPDEVSSDDDDVSSGESFKVRRLKCC